MQYFVIVFGAFFAVLCVYMYNLIEIKDSLLAENNQMRILLETQKTQYTSEKIDFLEKLEKSKNQTIDKFFLDKSNCQSELDSYKKLIRAM